MTRIGRFSGKLNASVNFDTLILAKETRTLRHHPLDNNTLQASNAILLLIMKIIRFYH